MYFRIYALENTRAELCAGSSTTSDTIIADIIRDKYLERGYKVVLETEHEDGSHTSQRYAPAAKAA